MTQNNTNIRPRERANILTALRTGVVPKSGLQHIQVGRVREVGAIISDLDTIADNGAACRFIIGEYGSGKTFFLNLTQTLAFAKKIVVAYADLSPDRKLHGTNGQARALYSEMIRNLATRSKPEGGALSSIVERFVDEASAKAGEEGIATTQKIEMILDDLGNLTGGSDWIRVLKLYAQYLEEDNLEGRNAVLTWLRGEYSSRTEARQALPQIRSIIDDSSAYDYTKVLAKFVRCAGYEGLLVIYDEMVNIHRIINSASRMSNYEQVLRMVNDLMQGGVEGMGIYFAGTPLFLTDTRRGLYSYEALRSRLSENTFARNGLVDVNGPVIRLQPLSPEDLFVLLANLRHLHAFGKTEDYAITDAGIHAFLEHCRARIGSKYFQTPRISIREFLNLLSIIEQNPGAKWEDLIGHVKIEEDKEEEKTTAPQTTTIQVQNTPQAQPEDKTETAQKSSDEFGFDDFKL